MVRRGRLADAARAHESHMKNVSREPLPQRVEVGPPPKGDLGCRPGRPKKQHFLEIQPKSGIWGSRNGAGVV